MNRYITGTLTTAIILFALWAMVAGPGDWDASAAYTDTVEGAHGLVDVAPHFAGLEAGFSSESIHFTNEYGDCGWEVNECWLTTFVGGVDLWEAANSYRGARASLEPVLAQDGVAVLVQDGTATDYNIRAHDGTDNIFDSNAGDWQMWMTGVGSQLEIYAPGQVPLFGGGAATTHHTFVNHDDIEGEVGTAYGDLLLNSADDVYTMDDVGIGVVPPTEALHVVGNPRFVTGGQGVGTIWGDDGSGTGVGEWVSHAQLTASIWFLYTQASADIAGYETLFPDPSVGVVASYNIAIPASPTLIEEFATEIGEPGITFIQNGILTFHFDARRSAGTKNCRVYAEVYSRTHPVGVETLLCTTEESNFLSNVQNSFEIHATLPATPLNATDRLVVKVYGNQYGVGANPTIQFYVEGATDTRIELPGIGAGSAFANMFVAATVKGADPTVVLLEPAGGECGRDFIVFVTVKDVYSCYVWQALSSPMPVADVITYYWGVDLASGDLYAYICNDSQRDVTATVWWSR